MKFNLPLPLFAPDFTGGGSGYELSKEQFDGLTLDDSEGDTQAHVPEPSDTPENSETDTPAEGGEPAAPSTLNIPGIGEVTLDQINEWRGGGLRQADYTKKTQELAEQRKSMEEQFNAYQQLDQMFSSNPQLEQQFLGLLQQNGLYQPNQVQNPQFDPMQHPMFQQMQSQLQQQQSMFEQWQQEQMRGAIQREWETVSNKFPEAKDKQAEIAKFVDDYNATNNTRIGLEAGYKLMNFDNIVKQTQEQMVKNNMKKKEAATIKPANQAAIEPDTTDLPGGGYEALVAHLMKKDLNLNLD